jgi:hypothetical protein
MFIVWGKKLVYRRVGYVGDFCPICRVPRPFELKRVGSAGHIYYISAGEGQLVGFERHCQECKTSLRADPADYASVSKAKAPLAELVQLTFPDLAQVLKDRLALEERVQLQPESLSREERHALIRNPFLLLSPKVEKRFAATHIDKEVGLSIAGVIGLLIVGPGLVRAVAPDQAELFLLLFVVLGLALVVWQIIASGGRFMRREVVPVLADSLRPLRPTEPEIRSVLSELTQLRHKMASKLKPADLLARLQA